MATGCSTSKLQFSYDPTKRADTPFVPAQGCGMDCTQRNHDAPDHTAELTKLRARLYAPELSALEAAAMLAATELLRAHERGDFEICDNGYCVSLISLCLGSPFELVHHEEEDCPCCCHD